MYFKYMIVSPVKRINLSCFLFISILFLFSYLTDLAKTSNATLRVDTVGNLVSILIFNEMFSVLFPI